MISIKFYLLFRRNFALFSFQKKKPEIGEKKIVGFHAIQSVGTNHISYTAASPKIMLSALISLLLTKSLEMSPRIFDLKHD